MKNSFTMLVGLVANGKSTYANKLSKLYNNSIIIESDAYRKKNYGNESVQGDNNKLFEEIHNDILENLSLGSNVIFDATNLSRRNRLSLLNKLPKDVSKECIIVATQYEKCLEQNRNRERRVPEEVIDRMYKSFQVPTFTEGWDLIDIEYNYNKEDYSIEEYLKFADNFDQKNYHHSLTLGGHSRKVGDLLREQKVDEHIYLAGLLHDCGKPMTQVFTNIKGEPSEIGHYYNHENCGAYEGLFYMDDKTTKMKDLIESVALINCHMRPYMAKTEKAVNKIKEIMGDSYYWLELLHNADKEAH